AYTEAGGFPARVELEPIGVVRSPYKERFGTPVQAEPAQGDTPPSRIELFPERVPVEALEGLIGIDYVWVIGFLHLNHGFRAKVMPPRGPRVRRGVLSTRSPHRPNPISLSAARLVGVDGHVLTVGSLDLLDGTPILDLKPYVPYADAFPGASAGWIDEIDPHAPQLGKGPRGKHREGG
ncbi:MAG: tRNA (N6-threonylcarbamoyladenosine(37)-N6)-methyltransferase TrmO, partial [Polyangiaceae bacterium]|nr:tRNA (N6-threonylcarbamoyladenosine(37)-N6)-methyltransferase TrmO [Polyangiaceae bacterium]